jgi:hypothetical protein
MRYFYPQSDQLLAGVYYGQNRVACCIINEYTLRGLTSPSGIVSGVGWASWSYCSYLWEATSVFISCCAQPGPLTSQHYRQCRDVFRNSFLFYLTMIYKLSLKDRKIINVVQEAKKILSWRILNISLLSVLKEREKYEVGSSSYYNLSFLCFI